MKKMSPESPRARRSLTPGLHEGRRRSMSRAASGYPQVMPVESHNGHSPDRIQHPDERGGEVTHCAQSHAQAKDHAPSVGNRTVARHSTEDALPSTANLD